MSKDFLKKTAVFVIFIFGFFLLSESFPKDSANQQRDKELLQQGEDLYKNGEYEKALKVFQEAEPYITDNNERLILHFHMSLTYYALDNSNQAEESLRKVFGLDPGYSVIEENYPRGFIKIFNKIKTEIKAKIEAEKRAKEKEKEKERVIEKPKPKAPEKKKKKFPVLLVVAGVAVVAAAAVLLGKKKSGSSKLDGHTYEFVTDWGRFGIGNGEFWGPTGIATDSDDNIYVADKGNGRIQKFTSRGNFITKWNWARAFAVTVDSNNYIYVTTGARINKFTSNGAFVTDWGNYGNGPDQFYGIAADKLGYIYVVDYVYEYIQKFTSTGEYILMWGSSGSGNGQFSNPCGISVDNSGSVYVADTGNSRIQKFTSQGVYEAEWNFSRAHGVEVDNSGYVYVVGESDPPIKKFKTNGEYVVGWGDRSAGSARLEVPYDVALDSRGNVYVCDRGLCRIQKYRLSNQIEN